MLLVSNRAQKISWKYKWLKYLQKRLKIDIITLNKIQINNDLMQQSQRVSDNLFRGESHVTIMSHNKHELIETRQQGGMLTTIKGKYVKFIVESGMNQ